VRSRRTRASASVRARVCARRLLGSLFALELLNLFGSEEASTLATGSGAGVTVSRLVEVRLKCQYTVVKKKE